MEHSIKVRDPLPDADAVLVNRAEALMQKTPKNPTPDLDSPVNRILREIEANDRRRHESAAALEGR